MTVWRWFMFSAACLLAAACAPANERPLHGAQPGSEAPTPIPGVPPTLVPSSAFRALPTPQVVPSPQPSPGLSISPQPSASVVAARPIVRTIAPTQNSHVPGGAPVTLSAVLVGRGADLATASLLVNGADAGAQIDKRTARDWTIHTSRTLANGTNTVRVFVRDASGQDGGFTWQFVVGEEPPATPTPAPQP